MSKNYSWVYPLILIGAIGIGAYFVYNWLKKSPISEGVNTITNTIEKITEKINTPYVTYNLVNPGTGKTETISSPTPYNFIFPPSGIPGFIDYTKTAGSIQTGTIAKTSASIIGAVSSPSAREALKTTFLDLITFGLVKPSTTTPKTLITSKQGTYVATSPVVGINWQSVGPQISQPTKDLFTAIQTKILEARGLTDLKIVGTEVVATNAFKEPVKVVDMGTGTITQVSQIVPKPIPTGNVVQTTTIKKPSIGIVTYPLGYVKPIAQTVPPIKPLSIIGSKTSIFTTFNK